MKSIGDVLNANAILQTCFAKPICEFLYALDIFYFDEKCFHPPQQPQFCYSLTLESYNR